MSRSCSAFHSGRLPMITVSITRLSSNANWSCERMPSFLGRETSPLVGSISPVSIFISVDLPAPLGPVIPYRRPSKKVVDTSSNKTRGPKRIVTLLIESIAYVLYRKSQEFRSTPKRELHEEAALRMKTILRGPGGKFSSKNSETPPRTQPQTRPGARH